MRDLAVKLVWFVLFSAPFLCWISFAVSENLGIRKRKVSLRRTKPRILKQRSSGNLYVAVDDSDNSCYLWLELNDNIRQLKDGQQVEFSVKIHPQQ